MEAMGKKNDSESRALWEMVTKTVTPYHKPLNVPPKPPVPPLAVRTVALPQKQALPADRGVEAELRRGRHAVERRLDMHGMTQEQAFAALSGAVAAARRAGQRTILVITGKGRLSEGGGVLRRMLPLWLESPALAGHVLAFTPARAQDGGAGAFYVRLRKEK